MSEATTAEAPELVEQITGSKCSFCDGGRLARGEYKDTPAVVCQVCGTPTVRLF